MRTYLPLLAAATALLPVVPASAAGAAAVTGYGIFGPGNMPLPTTQNMRFWVSGTLVGTTPGAVSCTFSIDEFPSSTGGGAGSGTGECSGAVTVSGTCTSQRTGLSPVIACSAGATSFGGTFSFTPRSILPLNDYDVTGQVTVS